jgi:hypothetical protein
MLGSGLNLVSAALGFGMTAAFVAFVCARFVCCRARRADASASRPHPSPVDFDAVAWHVHKTTGVYLFSFSVFMDSTFLLSSRNTCHVSCSIYDGLTV